MDYTREEIGNRIFKLHEKIRYHKTRMYNGKFKVNAMKDKNVSERQFVILILVSAFKVNTVTAISHLLDQTTGSVSTVISKLVRDGYLKKVYPAETEDRRKVYYIITDKGKNLVYSVMNNFISNTSEFIKSFSEDKQQTLKKATDSISFLIQDNSMDGSLLRLIDSLSYEFKDPADEMAFSFIKHMMSYAEKITKDNAKKLKEDCVNLISENKFWVLGFLSNFEYESLSQVADYMNLSESSVSIIMSKLVDEGFLERKYPSRGQDGRKVYFKVTEKGEEIYLLMKNKICTSYLIYYDDLNTEKKELVLECIETVSKLFK